MIYRILFFFFTCICLGTPKSRLNVDALSDIACREMELLAQHNLVCKYSASVQVIYLSKKNFWRMALLLKTCTTFLMLNLLWLALKSFQPWPEFAVILKEIYHQISPVGCKYRTKLICIIQSQVEQFCQVLAGGNNEAMAIAHSTGMDFIRCEGFVFGHVADEGYIDSCAGSLMRYRRNIGADNVQIFCDIKKKHRYLLLEVILWAIDC